VSGNGRRGGRPVPPAPLYERASAAAQQLVAAAFAEDEGAELGRIAGLASLDRRLAATMLGILAKAVVAASNGAAGRA
jgi:hypothetical protein